MNKDPILCVCCQCQRKFTASNSLCWLAWKVDMKWESICFNNWQSELWSALKHFHLKAQPFRGQRGSVLPLAQPAHSAGPSASQSPHLNARTMEWHKCAQCYHWTSWTAGRKHLHYSQTPRKMSHAVFFRNETRMKLLSFLTGGESERSQALCRNLRNHCSNLWAFPFMKGLSQMCERMATTVYFVTPRYQKYLCEAWIDTGKK